jgi:hypothetical protein
LLVVVRKQLRRQWHTAGLVLRQRGGLDQGADVQHYAQLAAVEQGFQRSQLWCQGHLPCIGQGNGRVERGGGQTVARRGQCLADLCVGGVADGIVRHQGIAVIIATIEKHAHQCLVIAGCVGGCGFADCGQIQRPGRGGANNAKAGAAAQEFSTGDVLDRHGAAFI